MRIHERPWALSRGALDQIEQLVRSGAVPPAQARHPAIRADDGDGEGPEAERARRAAAGQVVDGILHLRVAGILVHGEEDLAWLRGYGLMATTYGELHRALDAAAAQQVRGVLVEVDSPGGDAFGVGELGDRLYALRARVPVHAWCGGLAASAGYWLASQAQVLTAYPSAWLGSIGTYLALVDDSERWKAAGMRMHVIASSPFKATGHPGLPITPEQLQPWQRLVAEMQGLFRLAVARGRGLAGARLDAVANAQVWTALSGQRLGLCDGLGTRSAALAGLRAVAGSASGAGPGSASTPTVTTTSTPAASVRRQEPRMPPRIALTMAALITALPSMAAEIHDWATVPGVTPETLHSMASERARQQGLPVPAESVIAPANPAPTPAAAAAAPVAPAKPAATAAPATPPAQAAEGEGEEEEETEDGDPMMARVEALEARMEELATGLSELRAAVLGDGGEGEGEEGQQAAPAAPAKAKAPAGKAKPAPAAKAGGLLGALAGIQQDLKALGARASFAASAPADPGGAGPLVTAAVAAAGTDARDPESAKRVWDGNPAIRAACFGDFETFKAAVKADGLAVAVRGFTRS